VLDQPPDKLALVSALIATLGFFLTAAVAADDDKHRSAWLAGTVVLLLLCLGYTYWQLWPTSHATVVAEYTVNGEEESQYLPGHGEAGGPVLVLEAPQLYSGRTYQFGCQVILRHRAVWLRLAREPYWYPLSGLHAPRGTRPPPLPTCSA
jgi:hypothetical protein